jgi:hypothetical protein
VHHDEQTSTTDGVSTDPRIGARMVWIRRAFIALLALVVAAGAIGLLGVRSRTVTAMSADANTSLSVEYAQVARAGLDVPFRVTIHRNGGFDQDLTVVMSSDYLDLFDRNTVDPEPSESTATDQSVIWRFSPPPTDTFEITVDMQVQGGRHWGRGGSAAVLADDGSPLVQVTFKTWLVP